jgi:hypothetical protein
MWAASMAGSRNQTGNAEHGISCKTRHLYFAQVRHYSFAVTNRVEAILECPLSG